MSGCYVAGDVRGVLMWGASGEKGNLGMGVPDDGPAIRRPRRLKNGVQWLAAEKPDRYRLVLGNLAGLVPLVKVYGATPVPSNRTQASITPSAGPSTVTPSCSAPSSIFPYLHRLDIGDDMYPRRQKMPLLTLELSSLSFLDSVAIDDVTGKPLYAVETVGSSTTIWRSDPWDGMTKAADIRWPKELHIKGKGKENVNGSNFEMEALGQCLSCLVASLEIAVDSIPPRLHIFEALENRYNSRPQLDHAGIAVVLLDHLFVTALLLVTEPEEWMTIAHHPDEKACTETQLAPKSASVNTPASARQWRKIMYGEPLYPSLKTPCFEAGAPPSCVDDADVLDLSEPSHMSTSIQQWRKIVYGEPLYPSLRPHCAAIDLPPRPSTACDTASISDESAYYPPTPSSAPSTGFFDSAFFEESQNRQSCGTVVPRIDTSTRYTSQPFSATPISSIPSSDYPPLSSRPLSSPHTGGRRELPMPPSSYHPPASSQPWLHRSRSSPSVSPAATEHTRWATVTGDGIAIPPPVFDDDPEPLSRPQSAQSSRNRAHSASGSLRRRRLPQVPRTPEQHQPPLPTDKRTSVAVQRTLPPTPLTVSRSGSPGHRHAHSQSNAPTQPPAPAVEPVTPANTGSNGRRVRHEKDADAQIDWMRALNRAHRRRTATNGLDIAPTLPTNRGPEDGVYDVPPPAYNAIDFSTPPHAMSPHGR
ncbi:hypothetical protein SERLA73DRAFT_160158 [Serpula lacrymans var. lacrymans S7.3]|uniref:Uncharacterized protein n=1 Tax=Serpula lacrymans var. lacrymans (strain S7.3) TaxID=936435 RepID=F8PVP0_SERL3|nr:hypothetical protein SERLA73DRAFT_160158 [Serpula lacrymans var. lacrymans S7.3]